MRQTGGERHRHRHRLFSHHLPMPSSRPYRGPLMDQGSGAEGGVFADDPFLGGRVKLLEGYENEAGMLTGFRSPPR